MNSEQYALDGGHIASDVDVYVQIWMATFVP